MKPISVMTKDMTHDIQTAQQGGQQGEIILYQPDETVRLEVRLEDDTVWLTQQQMAELFAKDRTVIGRHIRNVYNEGELQQSITCAKFAHMGSEGDQRYEFKLTRDFFPCDMGGVKTLVMTFLMLMMVAGVGKVVF